MAFPVISVVESVLTVDFWELPGSPTRSKSPEGYQAQRVLRCAWDSAELLADELLGGISSSGGRYFYRLPHRFPWRPQAFAKSVSIEPFFGDSDKVLPVPTITVLGVDLLGDAATYDFARLTVQYEIPKLDIDKIRAGLPIVTESLEVSVQMSPTSLKDAYLIDLPLDPESYTTTIDPTTGEPIYYGSFSNRVLKPTEAPGRVFKMITWNYSFKNLSEVPTEIWSIVNHVNSETLYSPKYNLTVLPETLLVGAPKISDRYANDGKLFFDVDIAATWKPEGWNRLVDPADPNPIGPSEGSTIVPYNGSKVVAVKHTDGTGWKIKKWYPSARVSGILPTPVATVTGV